MPEIFNPLDAEFQGGRVRYTSDVPRKASVFDVIRVVTGTGNPHQKLAELQERFPEVLRILKHFKFRGQGQRETPVTDARGLVTIMNLLPGERAARFRAKEADVLVRYLGGDPSLIDEIQGIRRVQATLPADHPGRMFGEEVEARGAAEDRALRVRELDLEEKRIEEERPGKMLRLAEQAKTMLEGIGMFEISDKMTFKALVTTAMGARALPARENGEQRFYTLSELLANEHGKVVNWKDLREPGGDAARAFRNVTGRDPDKKTTECNGRLVAVNAYGDKPVADNGMTGWKIAEIALRHHGIIA